jgi:hypothetical protein
VRRWGEGDGDVDTVRLRGGRPAAGEGRK